MINTAYVSDENDSWRTVTQMHYRHYLGYLTNKPMVTCMQDFDYADYDGIRFLCPEGWFNEHDAIKALTHHGHLVSRRPDPDTVIAKYAGELRSIYDNRTAGDYTFEGVLTSFLMEVQGLAI